MVSIVGAIEQGRRTAQNPFSTAISRVNELQAERRAQEDKLALEAAKLKNLFAQLGKQHEFNVALEEDRQSGEQKLESQKQAGRIELEREEQKDPLTQLGIRADALRDAREIGDEEMIDAILGEEPVSQQGQGVARVAGLSKQPPQELDSITVGGQTTSIDTSKVNEIDRRTGKPTADALAAREFVKTQARELVPEKLSSKEMEDILTDVQTVETLTNNARILSANKDKFKDFFGPNFTLAPLRRFASKFNDPKGVQTLISSVEQASQVYRVSVTGAQAGFNEIQFLRGIFPSASDLPDVFLGKTYLSSFMTQRVLERQIPLLRGSGRDVKGLESILSAVKKNVSQIRAVVPKNVVENLERGFIGIESDLQATDLSVDVNAVSQEILEGAFGEGDGGEDFTNMSEEELQRILQE